MTPSTWPAAGSVEPGTHPDPDLDFDYSLTCAAAGLVRRRSACSFREA